MRRETPARVNVTADLVILTVKAGALRVLVVERGVQPFRGRLALPGGFLRGTESLEETARRELAEETGLDDPDLPLEQVSVYSTPDRDPRERVITCSFLAIMPNLPEPRGGTDAAAARFVPVKSVGRDGDLAFDHVTILRDAVAQARAKLRFTTMATAFCGPTFTISELHAVYETIWGVTIDRPNFHRKVTECEGFVQPTGDKRTTSGRPAALYTAGGATLLSRPIMGGP